MTKRHPDLHFTTGKAVSWISLDVDLLESFFKKQEDGLLTPWQ